MGEGNSEAAQGFFVTDAEVKEMACEELRQAGTVTGVSWEVTTDVCTRQDCAQGMASL